MLSWNEIVQKYIIKHSNQIQKITRPLREHFGIEYFTYHQIDNEGKYVVLVDQPRWAEHYVDKQIYLDDPYLRHPQVYHSGITMIQDFGSEKYKQTVMKACKNVLDVDVGTLFIHKTAEHVEFFGFAAKKTSALEKLTLNQTPLLKSFASYFKKELRSLLQTMETEANHLFHLKGKDFCCADPIYPTLDPLIYKAYLKDLGLSSLIKKATLLSSRENQCIRLLLEGKSAKETGLALRLSPRTIEFYLENIKNKLSCTSKQEILKIGQELDRLGLLIWN